ncbi:translation initiation factor IF-2 [Aliarcobacter butzleri]|uniref:Translation initiation factor IF-2 n=2 Tax=Aliarcobacter butzleri TaxID=28197 RepID=A0AAW7QAX4_9BACT|nr:translation initiation factor IF-2 [Aliarcobacter butzleri]KLE02408.1 translation initiation factor IF-2 [Aliarcobacter butzleri L351]KLE13497.1 translation initiation factor IF-2 [Aliarcobacter butzleri L350]MCG3669895.1 translation initiation factor IF-2 [Aliarcobacter butzleri]MCG3672697.1 translation initiation factor IF-2 [Aliarcobacter butzleri]MCG3681229.1 translation initiation factor IF-2 [Aliarcobacter butzleri]
MSDTVRVYEIAEEAGASSQDVIAKAKDLGIELKSPQTAVSYEDAEEITKYMMTGKSERLATKPAKVKKVVKKEEVKKETEEIETPKEKIETVQKVEKEIIKKPELKKVEISKPISKAPQKSEEESENLENPNKIVPKRKGLVIIKKKRPKEEELEEQQTITENQSKKQMKSLSEILGGVDDEEKSYNDTRNKENDDIKKQKAKKEKKKPLIKTQDHGKKLDVDREYSDEFASSEDSLLGEEIVLLDMDLSDSYKIFDEPKPQNIVNQSRSSKPAAFGNVPQGLKRGKRKKRIVRTQEKAEITSVTIPEDIRVYEFAEACGKSPAEVITVLFSLGMMVTKNDFLKQDELEILGEEFGIEVTVKDALEDVNYVETYNDEEDIDTSSFVTRPPVVTIMGHVDHGKTSLLDKIRSSKVAAGEAGGITQHITSYTVTKNGQEITFVDTPGHAAFSAMRARGANVTDIIIIVVAADDGVKMQTEEVISHAKASGCPIIVAMNKMDKETANPDMVKAQMAEKGLTPIDWGGDIEFIGVSARTGDGIEDLLENILLQAEILELKADPTAKAKATVIEASLEKGRGPVANVIVQNGTLRIGDNIVCDTTFGRVKAITDDNGKPVKELGLSQTGTVLGLNEVPTTGSVLVAMDTEKEVREIATTRAEHARAKELSKSTKVSLEEMSGLIAEGKIKQLPVIIKADVGGSLEAIKGSLEKIANDEVKVKVVHAAVGGITESDLVLAGASGECIILGFNVRPTGSVKAKAKADGVTINTYSIIYDLIDDVKHALSGMMSAVIREENTGQAEVRDTFVVPKVGTVAGCLVTDGKVIRGGHARIIRDGVVTYTGKISSLKRFKDDVKEVANGYECGIMFDKFNDIKVGDFIETFIQIEEKVSVDD